MVVIQQLGGQKSAVSYIQHRYIYIYMRVCVFVRVCVCVYMWPKWSKLVWYWKFTKLNSHTCLQTTWLHQQDSFNSLNSSFILKLI